MAVVAVISSSNHEPMRKPSRPRGQDRAAISECDGCGAVERGPSPDGWIGMTQRVSGRWNRLLTACSAECLGDVLADERWLDGFLRRQDALREVGLAGEPDD